LQIAQGDIRFHGHAIECRLNAEDPDNGFAPCPGTVTYFYAPGGPGIRVDSHLYSGYSIPPFYDSLLGKLIAWGSSRNEAIARMKRALAEMRIDGVKTTIGFHERLLENRDFIRGNVHTTFVESVFREES
jgi:acetyl-CoA carboxylase biotin carboxylase subunit